MYFQSLPESMRMCTYRQVYVCVHIYVEHLFLHVFYLCVCICMHAYIYMHIYIHIYTYIYLCRFIHICRFFISISEMHYSYILASKYINIVFKRYEKRLKQVIYLSLHFMWLSVSLLCPALDSSDSLMIGNLMRYIGRLIIHFYK